MPPAGSAARYAEPASPTWLTYRQAEELGGQVRRGETGSQVVYADRMKRTRENEQGEISDFEIPFLKAYTVFNCEQIDSLPAHYYARATLPLSELARLDVAERFVASSGARIQHGGNRAFYSITEDRIQRADLDIAAETRQDHASYVAHWLEVMKGDNRAIFTAAAHAQRAADYLHGLQQNSTNEREAA